VKTRHGLILSLSLLFLLPSAAWSNPESVQCVEKNIEQALPAPKRFSVDQVLLSKKNLETRLKSAFAESKTFMQNTTPSEVIESAFSAATPATRELLKNSLERVDHVGFLVPAGTDLATLERIANESGFPDGHRSFPSMIVAKELGAAIGKESVPTTIFICSVTQADGRKVAVEIFIPSEDKKVVQGWIREGVGTHVALRVKERAMVEQTKAALQAEGFQMPAFMNNQAMVNDKQGSLTTYFDLKHDQKRLRIEFVHVNEN
jgi:hypothetical protein